MYRTEPRPKSVNPFWRSRQVDLQQFCNHEMERPIQISVYINDSRGNRSLFGSCETTVTKLMEAICKRGNADTSNAFILRNRDGDKQMGFLVILKANIGVR